METMDMHPIASHLATGLFALALLGYGLDLILYFTRVGLSKPPLRSQRWILLSAFALHTLALAAASASAKQCPLLSLPDSLSFLAWLIILICLALGLRYRLQALEGFAPILVLLLMVASALLAVSNPLPQALPLSVPTRVWISLHAALYFLGYAAFAVMFLTGCVYLLLENQLKKRHLTVFTGDLSSLALMDKINHVALKVGVLCLTVGIATGLGILQESGKAVASLATDPKIGIALFTWVLYMALLFVRSTNRLRGRKVAYLSMAGFALVFVTFLGVQHWQGVY